MKPSVILIKKYGNRRLYDTAGSRYVNLDDLAAHVRAGREVRVVDAKTGQDLTRVTLTQIITEDAEFLKQAPHTTAISRPDEVKAAKEPILRWQHA